MRSECERAKQILKMLLPSTTNFLILILISRQTRSLTPAFQRALMTLKLSVNIVSALFSTPPLIAISNISRIYICSQLYEFILIAIGNHLLKEVPSQLKLGKNHLSIWWHSSTNRPAPFRNLQLPSV